MRISVFGMGYVGTVSASCFAELGHDVIGVDVNPTKIDMINRGPSPVVEEDLDEAVAAGVKAGRLRAIADTATAVLQSDISLISAGAPMGRTGAPMLDALDAVVDGLGSALRHKNGGHTVVLRSTVPPGTTEGRMLPMLAAKSGRDADNGIAVAFNPEFLREGCSVRDFLSSVMPANDAHIDPALQAILDEGRRKVALLGLAFKSGTDDLRHSPFVYLAERLIGKGYDLAIFDRNVNASKLLGKNREFIEREIPHFDRFLISDLRRALDGAGMIVIGHASREDIAMLEAEHNGRPILDLQGVPALAELPGARYRSLC